MRLLLLGLAVSACSVGAASSPVTVHLHGEDGQRCAAFDYAPGLMVTSAHCVTSDAFQLSDGRTALTLKRGYFVPGGDEIAATEHDIALLMPSESRPAPPRDFGPIEPGTVLFLAPPGRAMLSCPLEERQGQTLFLSCYADLGWSGSPLYRQSTLGQMRVVGVLSGREPSRGLIWATAISAAESLR